MLAGIGIVGVAVGARVIMGSLKHIQKTATQLPKSPVFTNFYRGGFEPKMSRREAGLILGTPSYLDLIDKTDYINLGLYKT